MTVNELIKELKQYPEDMEVRIADVSPTWNTAYEIKSTYTTTLKSMVTNKVLKANILCLSPNKSKKVAEIV